MLVHIKDVMSSAKDRESAVGAFNVHNFESIIGVAKAAEKLRASIIMQVSEGAIKYIGLKPLTHLVSTVAKNIAINAKIALHLDHGSTFEVALECINAGFSSVHIDASHLPLDENISLTKEVVKIAHEKGVFVQGEIGSIIGGHGKVGGNLEGILFADPDEVIRLVDETGLDTIAAAIGTAHGSFTNERIDFELLDKIKAGVKIPFVLHGGSGIKDEEIREGIRRGVNIINIGTDIKVAFCRTVIDYCREHPDETDPRNMLAPAIDKIQKVVEEKIKLFEPDI
jgi:fructose-bisphosphate aldolase, class II